MSPLRHEDKNKNWCKNGDRNRKHKKKAYEIKRKYNRLFKVFKWFIYLVTKKLKERNKNKFIIEYLKLLIVY